MSDFRLHRHQRKAIDQLEIPDFAGDQRRIGKDSSCGYGTVEAFDPRVQPGEVTGNTRNTRYERHHLDAPQEGLNSGRFVFGQRRITEQLKLGDGRGVNWSSPREEIIQRGHRCGFVIDIVDDGLPFAQTWG